MSGQPTAAEVFWTQLRGLYEKARKPDLATLNRQGERQEPRVSLSDATLSDWFTGKSIPSKSKEQEFRFLVGFLEGRAGAHGESELRRRVDLWLRLCADARRSRRPAAAGEGPPLVRLGRPIGDCDPLALEVHPAIRVSGERLDDLPGYVPRGHDIELRQAAGQVIDGGGSRLVTVVGGSSTGKTRACWELARYLDERQPGRWWLWHPFDPTRPAAAAAAIDRVGPCTIVWLNEAQHYLAPTDAHLGERIAAGLRTLLQDPRRGPVLVLATLWPQFWDELTCRPSGGKPDRYAQARDLLAGSLISVADGFTPGDLAGLQDAGVDARVRQAAAYAEGGRITQYLAGAPELEARYRTAPPTARAIIQVAMDARRLGHPLALPRALLGQAAPGYVDDHDWDSAGENWLEQALAYTARPCKGARGPLTRIRPRPGQPATEVGQPCYRLADYLEQTGRHERGGVYPPDSLWRAFAATVADPALLRKLGVEAEWRGRYQHAIWLHTRAANGGDIDALRYLATLREQAGDTTGAEVLYRQAADRGNFSALSALARLRERAGDTTGAAVLYRKAAGRGDTDALRNLATLRERSGDTAGAEVLYRQAAYRGNFSALSALARLRERAGDTAGAEAMYQLAADRGDPSAVAVLVGRQERAVDMAGAEALYRQAARGDIDALRSLGRRRERAGDTTGAEAMYRQCADRGDTDALRGLGRLRERAGDTASAEALYQQAAARGNLGAPWDLARLRELAGDTAGAEALAVQAADRGNFSPLMDLARLRERAGDTAGAEALAVQAADRGNPSALMDLAQTREWAGHNPTAGRMRRFGLTGSGEVATALDFGS